jgi:hypothetical protein
MVGQAEALAFLVHLLVMLAAAHQVVVALQQEAQQTFAAQMQLDNLACAPQASAIFASAMPPRPQARSS